jgi:hypothetical protein
MPLQYGKKATPFFSKVEWSPVLVLEEWPSG